MCVHCRHEAGGMEIVWKYATFTDEVVLLVR